MALGQGARALGAYGLDQFPKHAFLHPRQRRSRRINGGL
jgi:hypothetical protein